MSFRDVMRVLSRWRWVLFPALVVAVGAAGTLFVTTPPEYSQTESYLLLYPVQSADGAGNPLLQLGNGVGLAASVLATKVSAPDTAASLIAGAPGVTYTVAPDAATTAPILVVAVQGPDRGSVSRALDSVGNGLVEQLTAIQRATGAPEASWVTISRLTRDPGATPSHKAATRYAAGALAGVLVLALLLIVGLERRARSRARASVDDPVPLPPVATRPVPPPATGAEAAGSTARRPVAAVAADHATASSGDR